MAHADRMPDPPLLEVRGMRKSFVTKGFLTPATRVVAAEDVSFRVRRGEAVALVGESGSGKSTLARMVLRLEQPDEGEVRLDGVDVLSREPRRASLAYRGRVQMVFQDPFSSLNPVHTIEHHLVRPLLRHGRALNPARDVGHHLERPLRRHRRAAPGEVRARALELLRTVGLEPAEDFIHRHPYELSGGQRQRVAIARALAVEPDLLVADEPTSMLDVSIRTGVLNLLVQLKRERGLAILPVINKVDRLTEPERAQQALEDFPNAVSISALKGTGTQELLAKINEILYETLAPITVSLPYQEGALIALFHEQGQIAFEEHQSSGVFIQGRLPGRFLAHFRAFEKHTLPGNPPDDPESM